MGAPVTPGSSDPSSSFQTPTTLWAVGVSLVLALAFVGLATFAPELRAKQDEGAHALSRSAVGYAGLVRLLQDTGRPAIVRRDTTTLTGQASLLVLTPPAGVNAQAVRAAAAYPGDVLIIAPKWMATASLKRPGWVDVQGLIPPSAAIAAIARPEVSALSRASGAHPLVLSAGRYQRLVALDRTFRFANVASLQASTSEDGVPLLQDPGGGVLLAVGGGRIFVLTDPDLLNNHGLADLESARSALAMIDLLRSGPGPVVFDVSLNGLSRPRSLLQTALTPPFFAATLCSLVALALVGWRATTRFGPAARPGRAVALGKRVLVDNAAGLIRLTRREARMAPRYAAVIREAVAHAVGAPKGQSAEQTDIYLDRLADLSRDLKPFSELVAEAGAGGGDVESLMRSARRLFQWKSEITRERR